jgi:HAD superfamily hydrolase (TIGR01509 family)
MLRALIWDIDGTVAETERDGHRVAFNRAFTEAGLPWQWDDAAYGRLLRVNGGRDRLLAFMQQRSDAPASLPERQALVRQLHPRKNAIYAELVAQGHIAARPGVLRLMAECRCEGVALAIATTTGRANVQALLGQLLGSGWREGFAAVVCAEDAPRKKPDPQAYALALQRLGLPPAQAFAIEDSPDGLRAALAAGLGCGVTRSRYFADARFEGAAWVRDDLDSPPAIDLAALRAALDRAAT